MLAIAVACGELTNDVISLSKLRYGITAISQVLVME